MPPPRRRRPLASSPAVGRVRYHAATRSSTAYARDEDAGAVRNTGAKQRAGGPAATPCPGGGPDQHRR
ncbi:hypothetical protein BU14_0245s0014 [Porphyra umbilicalis]|uniref:Uncharacterized protein n=1 Tax=Porphyra umbilicalis TaxID=2786 RepID=A0A1X6P2T6_PORUM|nr:hypothetical protein BU14_0245s0014 [Porphyra umbilicalis]|eukprot:OSX75232.1 hypothetical protein BU14_0245s0014 [Porphyra umbilicalis]